jgi:hypothetical protein
MNADVLDRFCVEIDRALGDAAGTARAAFATIAGDSPSDLALRRQCAWIAGQRDRTVLERIEAMGALITLLKSVRDRGGGSVVQIDAREFVANWCGWRDDGSIDLKESRPRN